MPTIHRQHGLRFAVLTDDFEPAHIHVFGAGEMRIQLADAAPLPVYAAGLTQREARKALAVATERRTEFLRRWTDVHRDAP